MAGDQNPVYGPFFGVMGAAAAIIFTSKRKIKLIWSRKSLMNVCIWNALNQKDYKWKSCESLQLNLIVKYFLY